MPCPFLTGIKRPQPCLQERKSVLKITGTGWHGADQKQGQEESLHKEVSFNFHARTFSLLPSVWVRGIWFSTVRGFISTLSGAVGDTFVFQEHTRAQDSKCRRRRKHQALGALSLVGTSSANRIFQLNAAGSLNPCDFCCLPREDEEHLVLGKCYPLFSCPKAVTAAKPCAPQQSQPDPLPQSNPGILAWCHIPLQPSKGILCRDQCRSRSTRGTRGKGTERRQKGTKPAPRWCLQRLWGPSLGVLCGFNMLVQHLRENQALLGLFWTGTRALETTGPRPGNGDPERPQPRWNYNSRQAPRMRGRGAETGGARAVGPAPLAPAAILSPTFTRRPTGRFFFFLKEKR